MKPVTAVVRGRDDFDARSRGLFCGGTAPRGGMNQQQTDTSAAIAGPTAPKVGMAVLAGGCFWCLEAVFRELNGVLKVEPGYCGGSHDTANYEQVCTGAKIGRAHV